MKSYVLVGTALAFAAPALAQQVSPGPSTAAAIPQEVRLAIGTYLDCLERQARAQPDMVSVEIAAARAYTDCQPRKLDADASFNRWMAGAQPDRVSVRTDFGAAMDRRGRSHAMTAVRAARGLPAMSPGPAPGNTAPQASGSALPPELVQSNRAFSICVSGKAKQPVPPGAAVEAVARQAIAECAVQNQIHVLHERYINGPAYPPAMRAAARTRLRTEMDAAAAKFVQLVRTARPVPSSAPSIQQPAVTTARPPPTPPEVVQSYETFNDCVSRAASGRRIPAGMTAADVAGRIMAGCAAQRAELERRHEQWIGGPAFPASLRADTRVDRALSLNGIETMVAQQLAQANPAASRSVTPAPAAPSTASTNAIPADVAQADQAVVQCHRRAIAAVPPTLAPETGARMVAAACGVERNTFATRFEAWLGRSGHPEATRATMRQDLRARTAGLDGQIAANIRATRLRSPAPTPRPTTATALSCTPVILYFGFGEAALTERARQSIAAFTPTALSFSRTGTIAVVGHDDVEPHPAAPNGLSQRRAAVVRDALIAAGVPASRIEISWHASGRPAIEVPRGAREPDNRRVELTCGAGSGW